MDLPYKAEYAKTGRAGCKGCKTTIDQATLRLAVMVQVSIYLFIECFIRLLPRRT